MLLPNFYHPFFLYCVKTPTNDDGNFGELEFLCTFVAKSKPLSKTRQSIANRTVSKSLPEHQPIVRNTLLQRVVAFLSKVTEIYCIADDFCKEYEQELNKKALSLSNPSPNTPKTRNRKGRMSDAEMITILVLFHSNTFRNFKHFYLFYICRELKDEFPNLLSYTQFVERMPRVAVPLLLFLKLALMGECTGITFIDSTRIPVCENKREYSNRVFKGYAHKGKSTMGWYYGFKLHLLCNERGELLNFALTKANVVDRNPEVFNNLTKDLFGKPYADKGYISQSLFASLFDRGIHIVTGIRTNMKNRLMNVHDKIMLRKRSIIETINDMLKNVAQIVHTRHRSISNFIVNLLAGMAAYAFYDTKPSINMEFEMEGETEVKQLTLF